ncbi:MAG: class I SAM-dependent methyltransferase [Treponema sp.]|jgi:predicted RNA methylase|nr:class I SAM-dependent methyltransferase [Treponema sp.]
MKIEIEVIEILAKSKIDETILYLPEIQLERKLYEKVNKALVILGGKWNRSKRGHVFEESPADAIDDLLLTGEVFDRKKEFQFFPTPPEVCKKICTFAEIDIYCDVLEPSAGQGNIAKEMLRYSPKSITVVELDEKHTPYLEGKYTHCFMGQDFLVWETKKRFDRIVMNPPFSKKQDIKHIIRAFSLLKPSGILVAILSPSPFFCADKLSQDFRSFISEKGAVISDFEQGTFQDSGTSIRTKCIKVVNK